MGARAVFLVGFMGAGKNTVGRELARRVGWDFVDLDEQIEHREAQTIPEIFRTKGEPAFRLAETEALREFLADSHRRNSVVALGGGAFVEQKNRALLREWPTVFLDVPVDELWQRCQQDGAGRPLRRDRDQFSSLHAQRLPFYREATLTVETGGKELLSICLEIEHALRLTRSLENLRGGESQ